MEDLALQTTRKVMSDMDRQKQTVIEDALKANGVVFADLKELVSDCEFKIYPDGTSVFCYKGRELLAFFPVTHNTKQDGISYIMSFKQEYKKLY